MPVVAPPSKIAFTPQMEKIRKYITNRFTFSFFLFWRLPAAFIAGTRVEEVTNEKCTISLPYKWLTQNPFKSIYFASQSMAGEMSTGIFGMIATYQSDPSVAMLVENIEAKFTKKADARIYFTCEEGQKILQAVEKAKQTGEAVRVRAETIGRMKNGVEVSRFWVTWSFKARTKKHV